MAVMLNIKKRNSSLKNYSTSDILNSFVSKAISKNGQHPIFWTSFGNNISPYINGPTTTNQRMISNTLVGDITQTFALGSSQTAFGGIFGGVSWSIIAVVVAAPNMNLVDSFNGNSGNTPYKISTDSSCLASINFESAIRGTYQLIPGKVYTIVATNTSAGFVSVYFNGVLGLSGSYSGGNSAGILSVYNCAYIYVSNNVVLSNSEIDFISQDPWKITNSTKNIVFLPEAISVYRPTSDDVVSGWSGVPGSSLYTNIDEVVYDDNDYIQSPDLATPSTFGLSSSLPVGSYDVKVRANANSAAQVRVKLLDSGNTVVGTSSWQSVSGAFDTYTLSVITTGIATKVKIEVQ